MRLLWPLALGLALGGCDIASDSADQIARNQAKGVVNAVVSEEFPGLNAAPVTDCIIDAASASEILDIARASLTGVRQETVSTVLDIARRPQALSCIAQNGASLL